MTARRGGFYFKQSFPGKQATSKLPEVKSGREVAAMVKDLYGKVSPRIGKELINPNVVLTLAGLKPYTWFGIDEATPQNFKEIKILDEFSKPEGIKFEILQEPLKDPQNRPWYQVNVYNLRGYERVSRQSNLPGVVPFYAKEGFVGLKQWRRGLYKRLEAAQARGEIPANYELVHMGIGLELGYPDQAIQDAAEVIASGSEWAEKLVDVKIPYCSMYNWDPSYSVYSKHLKDRTIKTNIAQAGKILKEFYESPWHQKISQDPEFIRARGIEKEAEK